MAHTRAATTALPCTNQDEYRRVQRRVSIHEQLYPLPLCKAGDGIVRGIFDHSGSVAGYKTNDPRSAIDAHLRALAHPAYNIKCRRELAGSTHHASSIQECILSSIGYREPHTATID
jgi:hypothetical protein